MLAPTTPRSDGRRARGSWAGLDGKEAAVADEGTHVEVSLDNGRHVRAEMLLYAAGRSGATADRNLGAVGRVLDAARAPLPG